MKQEISRVQAEIKKSGVSASWTRPDSVHLTLKFLGEVDESRAKEILGAVEAAATGLRPFKIEVAGIGVFPNPMTARVVWLGVAGEVDMLKFLQSSIEDAMSRLGFDREKRGFTPHLTLGRIRRIASRDTWLSSLEALKDIRLGAVYVEGVSLMKSELRRTGAVYTELGRVHLK